MSWFLLNLEVYYELKVWSPFLNSKCIFNDIAGIITNTRSVRTGHEKKPLMTSRNEKADGATRASRNEKEDGTTRASCNEKVDGAIIAAGKKTDEPCLENLYVGIWS